jgi:hypothetical protein
MQRIRAGEARPSWWSRLVDALEVLAQPRIVRPAALAAVGAGFLVLAGPQPLDRLAKQLGFGPALPVQPGSEVVVREPIGASAADTEDGLEAWRRRFGPPRSLEISRNSAERHMRQVIGSTVVVPTFQPAPSFRSLAPSDPFPSPYGGARIVDVTPANAVR